MPQVQPGTTLTNTSAVLQTSGNIKATEGAIRENVGSFFGNDEQQAKGALQLTFILLRLYRTLLAVEHEAGHKETACCC